MSTSIMKPTIESTFTPEVTDNKAQSHQLIAIDDSSDILINNSGGPKINNNNNGKSKAHDVTCKHASSKDPTKKLSFFHANEESEDEGSEDFSKSYKSSVADASVTLADCNKSDQLVIEGKVLEHKVAEPVVSDHEDDASSTSSCSCEDHSSAGHSEENPHGDLDYDEGSVTSSPTNGINNSILNNTSASVSNLHQSDTSKILELLDNQEPIHDASADQIKILKYDGTISNDSQTEDVSPSRKAKRIRSFISFDNHDRNGEDVGVESTAAPKEKAPKTASKDRSHKGYEGLLKYFFKNACYFQIKSINHENVEISKSKCIWSTTVQNEIRLNAAFHEHRNVILIFSVQQSGAFQGFARMTSESRPANAPLPWVLPERFKNPSLGGVFKVEWLNTKELPFHEARDLHNPFNDNKPVKIARDGQQVDPKVGKKLCQMFVRDSKKRLLVSIETLKRQSRSRKQTVIRHEQMYPFNDNRAYHTARGRHNLYAPPPQYAINGMDSMTVPSTSHSAPSNYTNFYPPPAGPSVFKGSSNRRRTTSGLVAPNVYQRHDLFPPHYMDSYPPARFNHHMPLMREYDCVQYDGHGVATPVGPHEEYPPDYYGMQFAHFRPPMGDWRPGMPDSNRYHPYQRSRR